MVLCDSGWLDILQSLSFLRGEADTKRGKKNTYFQATEKVSGDDVGEGDVVVSEVQVRRGARRGPQERSLPAGAGAAAAVRVPFTGVSWAGVVPRAGMAVSSVPGRPLQSGDRQVAPFQG